MEIITIFEETPMNQVNLLVQKLKAHLVFNLTQFDSEFRHSLRFLSCTEIY